MNDPRPNQPPPRERELFVAALERTDPAERSAFLTDACGSDRDLRQRVEFLLAQQTDLGSFLENPALADTPLIDRPGSGGHGTALLASVSERPGDRIGRYRLLQQIGEGGCGIVFMADQEEPVRRRVALKVIKLGMDTRSVIARFEAERQALAMMEHPNIARVLDAGATETGRPFFVMELVRGIRITDYCDQHKLTTAERLALFHQVCQAVQHAHQKGIIHRDLKPSNILVTVNDGVPVPKVIDFGIAKATEQRLTEKTLFTEFTAFIGTPAYMSPEQAEMSSLDIDTRSDIYSLGVLLYELLTGRTPFDPEALMRGGLDACRRTIREQEPVRPSTRLGDLTAIELTSTASQRRTEAPKLVHSLRGDLDWIAMKCLEKDRTRRYPTANALALDLQRYLDNEPVLARPPSTTYRLRKLLRKHRLMVSATAAVSCALVLGASISIWQAIRATRAEEKQASLREQAEKDRERARESEAAARLNEYIADMSLAQQSLAAGNFGRAVQLVDKHRPHSGEPDLRGFEWRYLWQLCQGDEHFALTGQTSSVQTVAFTPDGRLAILGLRDQTRVLSLLNRNLVAALPRDAFSLACLPDGKTLISAGRSGVRLWQTADWSEQRSLPEASGPVALSSDGTRLATQTHGGVRVFDTATWTAVKSLPGAYGALAFSPDGSRLATDSRQGITLWSLQNDDPGLVLADSTNVFLRTGPWYRSDRVMAFSPDGKFLVAARNPPSARGVFVLSVWDTATGNEGEAMPSEPEHVEHTGIISSIAFSPDGQTLATASFDHSIRLWDFPKRRTIRTLHAHRNEVWGVAFSPDGQNILSGAKDGGVHLWPTQPPPVEDLLPDQWLPLSFTPDSRFLVANRRNSVAFFDLATSEISKQHDLDWHTPGRPGGGGFESRPPDRPGSRGGPPEGGPPKEGRGFGFPQFLQLSADARVLAQGSQDGRVQLLNTDSGETTAYTVGRGRIDVVALSPNGRIVLTGGWDRPIQWWEFAQSTNALATLEGSRAVFSPDGRQLALLQRSNTVQLWDVAQRAMRTNFVIDPAPGFPVAFSPDGTLLATTASMDDVDNGIHLWSTATGRLVRSCYGHKQPVQALAFAPEGGTLASSADDGTVKLWNLATSQELLSVRKSGNPPRTLRFSPDGRLLVGSGGFFSPAGALRVFRAPSLKDIDQATSR